MKQLTIFPSISKQSLLTLLVLLTTVLVGNYFKLPLLFGIDFLFGSIAVLIVIYLFGTTWGVLAATITGIQTIIALNHPYAAIVYIFEALFVGLLLKRQRENILWLDMLYWLFVGMPLIWVLSYLFLSLDVTEILLIMFKQAVNGIYNALIATLLISYTPIQKLLPRPHGKQIALEKNLLNVLTSLIFFPSLILLVLDSNRVTHHITDDIQTELQSTSITVVSQLENWHKQRINALEELAQIARENNLNSSLTLQRSTEVVRRLFLDLDEIVIKDAGGQTVVSSPANQLRQDDAFSLSTNEQAIANLKPAISNVHSDINTTNSHLHLTVPIVNSSKIVGVVNSIINLKNLINIINLNTEQGEQQIAIFDERERIIISTKLKSDSSSSFSDRPEGMIRQINPNLYNWLPNSKPNQPPISRWKQSLYGQEIRLSNLPLSLAVEIPAEAQVQYIQSVYTSDLGIILLIVASAISFAVIISRRIAKPLAKLAVVTNNLPYKLTKGEEIEWFNSSIIEIESLISNFKSMAIALSDKFAEIQGVNISLEQQVQERTSAIVQTKQSLVKEIDRHQQTESALLETEARYWDLFENANDLIQSVTPEGYFLYVNRAWRETLGYSAAEVNSLTIFDIIDCDSREHCLEIFEQVMSGEEVDKVEAEFVTKYGEKIIVEGSVNCKFLDGEPVSTRSIFRNITERKRAEVEIQYALAKERELGELKSRFISIASHEFRTPLTIIFMSIKLLEQFSEQATAEQKALYFERIKAATKRMTDLLDDILVISKSESGKLSFSSTHLALHKFCCELIEEMRLSASSDRIITFVSQGDDSHAYVDEKLLRHILTNLVSNAIKYSPQGGDVSLHLTCTPKKAIFEIKDSGIGIPPADVEKLFGSFHRGSNVKNIPGTGLGLSIVKQCVDLHGGTITVKSEVGLGTTFIVTIPFIKN
ncbi:sensor histidine kinase [Aliterella atlantica]|uniref:histidine kinase n=1 Tax=Aliterella atlantica CENA595 TaxID=1618023 RepID=A0A0D8ZQ97_9CYAN|nr:ATP-binding protein [Aliterella atlantica]KJH70905.1 hypothetical protein UH38_15015 [Aliterella atlantica CENA595]